MTPTQPPETRGRKPIAPEKRREPACYTLPPKKKAAVERSAKKIGVPASRFIEVAVDVALASCDDPEYRAAVLAASKKKA